MTELFEVPNNVVWCAQPGSQQLFFSVPYEVFEVLLEGTRGGGKTDSLIMDFARECGKGLGAHWKGYLFKRTNPELKDVKDKCRQFLPAIFPGIRFRESPYFEIIWPTGETLMCRHMGDDKDYWAVHGSSVTWIGWEELSNWATPNLFLRCMSLCRSAHPEAARRKRIRATTNPGGPGHNWIRERYQLPMMRNRIIEADDVMIARKWMSEDQIREDCITHKTLRMAIFSKLDENKVFCDADPSYRDMLKATANSEAQYRAWIYGDWDIVAGGMFDDVWNRKHHWIQPFAIPESWRIDRSFDWGESKPFSVGYWAQSDGSDLRLNSGKWASTVRGDLFRIGEIYGWNGQPNTGCKATSSEIAERCLEWELVNKIYRRCQPGPADPAIFQGYDGKASVATEMAANIRRPNGREYRGIHFVPADNRGKNGRVPGWGVVRQMFKNAIRIDGRPRERAGLFCFDNCIHFGRTMPVMPRDEKKPDDVNSEAEDHIADETRYRCVNVSVGLRQSRRTV